MADAQGEDEPVQRDGPPGLDRRHQVADRGLAIAVPLAQGLQRRLVAGQAEDVRGFADQALLVEGGELLLSQALDVERAPRDEQLEVLDPLERAGEFARAAAHHGLHPGRRGLPRQRSLERTGADLGKGVGRRPRRPGREHRPDHLRDHVPGPLDDHRVADAHVLPGDLVGVVQGGVAHGRPTDEHRRQLGDGGDRPSAADLELDAFERGRRLLGGELVGDGPAGLAAGEAQPLLPVQPVDLVDHPVDVVAEPGAAALQGPVDGEQALHVLDPLRQGIGPHAPRLELPQGLGLGGGERGAGLAPRIGEEA